MKSTRTICPFSSADAPPASSYLRLYREAAETYERERPSSKTAETDGNISRTAGPMSIDRSHLYRRRCAPWHQPGPTNGE